MMIVILRYLYPSIVSICRQIICYHVAIIMSSPTYSISIHLHIHHLFTIYWSYIHHRHGYHHRHHQYYHHLSPSSFIPLMVFMILVSIKIMSSSIPHLFTTFLPSIHHLFTIFFSSSHHIIKHIFTIYPSIYSVADLSQSWILWSWWLTSKGLSEVIMLLWVSQTMNYAVSAIASSSPEVWQTASRGL